MEDGERVEEEVDEGVDDAAAGTTTSSLESGVVETEEGGDVSCLRPMALAYCEAVVVAADEEEKEEVDTDDDDASEQTALTILRYEASGLPAVSIATSVMGALGDTDADADVDDVKDSESDDDIERGDAPVGIELDILVVPGVSVTMLLLLLLLELRVCAPTRSTDSTKSDASSRMGSRAWRASASRRERTCSAEVEEEEEEDDDEVVEARVYSRMEERIVSSADSIMYDISRKNVSKDRNILPLPPMLEDDNDVEERPDEVGTVEVVEAAASKSDKARRIEGVEAAAKARKEVGSEGVVREGDSDEDEVDVDVEVKGEGKTGRALEDVECPDTSSSGESVANVDTSGFVEFGPTAGETTPRSAISRRSLCCVVNILCSLGRDLSPEVSDMFLAATEIRSRGAQRNLTLYSVIADNIRFNKESKCA